MRADSTGFAFGGSAVQPSLVWHVGFLIRLQHDYCDLCLCDGGCV